MSSHTRVGDSPPFAQVCCSYLEIAFSLEETLSIIFKHDVKHLPACLEPDPWFVCTALSQSCFFPEEFKGEDYYWSQITLYINSVLQMLGECLWYIYIPPASQCCIDLRKNSQRYEEFLVFEINCYQVYIQNANQAANSLFKKKTGGIFLKRQGCGNLRRCFCDCSDESWAQGCPLLTCVLVCIPP